MRPIPAISAVPLLLIAALVPAAVASAPAHRALPHNGRIAYSVGAILPDPDTHAHSQVFTVRPDGSGKRQLTHVIAPVQAGDPNYSPNGRRIAYVSNATGRFQVWVMSASGAHQHRLVVDPRRDAFLPRWAPDGKHLVFTRCYKPFGSLECAIATVRSDGSQLHVMKNPGHWFNFDARYTPDARKIMFSTERGGYTSVVWVARPDGSAAHRLTSPNIEAFWPDVSPRTGKVLVTNNFDRPNSNLLTMRRDGTHVRRVTHVRAPRQSSNGSYSPDGRRIVFDSIGLPGHEWLAVMNADGSHVHKIVKTGNVTLADWGAAR